MEVKTLKDLKESSPSEYAKHAKAKRQETLGWYALSVTAQHERKILEAFTGVKDKYSRDKKDTRSKYGVIAEPIEAYLPIREEKHKWSDRVRIVPVVLTPGIIFVRIKQVDRSKLYINEHIHGFLFDKDKREPALIRDSVMKQFRKAIDEADDVSVDLPQPGSTVMIVTGKFEGYVGEVIRKDGMDKFQLRLSDRMALTFSINQDYLRVVPKGTVSEFPDTRFV